MTHEYLVRTTLIDGCGKRHTVVNVYEHKGTACLAYKARMVWRGVVAADLLAIDEGEGIFPMESWRKEKVSG